MFILADTYCTGDATSLLGVFIVIRVALKIIQYVVPIILILLGTIDLVKAVSAGKEEDIKKNQNTLIKRIIMAIIVFIIPLLVSILMGLVGNGDWRECWKNAYNKDLSTLLQDTALNPSN